MLPDPDFPSATGGRAFAAGSHFLTLRTRRGRPGLVAPPVVADFQAALHLLTLEGPWLIRTAVLLPTEAHLVAAIPPALAPAGLVDLVQYRLAPCLGRARIDWAGGFLDRPLPPGADALPTFRYLYRAPYRAGLAAEGEPWPGYHCAAADWRWFGPLAGDPVAGRLAG